MDIVKTAYRFPTEVVIMVKSDGTIVSARDLHELIRLFGKTNTNKIKMFATEERLEALYLDELRNSFDTLFKVYGIECSFYF